MYVSLDFRDYELDQARHLNFIACFSNFHSSFFSYFSVFKIESLSD